MGMHGRVEQAARCEPGRSSLFRLFATKASQHLGTPWAFGCAVVVVLGWLISGPLFHFSDAWQLVINTGTTIVTFLMVFLVQTTQNRDSRAIQLKLDELIRTSRARNVFADLENATDQELDELQRQFKQLRARGLARGVAAAKAGAKLLSDPVPPPDADSPRHRG
jgi:low affinity Fe/Cu permease